LKIIFWISFVFSFSLLQIAIAQDSYILKGKLIDNKDSLPLIFGQVFISQEDGLANLASTNDLGEFEFKNLKAGKYTLESDYFYFPTKTIEINLKSDSLLIFGIDEGEMLEQLKNYKFKSSYTIYYYGIPVYDDEDLNQIGKQYGVKFIGLGCVGDRRYNKYNLMIEQILNYKNGVDWEDRFWNEVAKTLDK
jgi:hypothetical protein